MNFASNETAITKQIRKAYWELPKDFELQILIQKDYVLVRLLDEITDLSYSPQSDGMTVSEQIADCLAYAKKQKRT